MAQEGTEAARIDTILRDQAVSLAILTSETTFGMTLSEAADEVEAATGLRPPLARLSRLQNGIRIRPIVGLNETEIGLTFYTSSGIAAEAQIEELGLRWTPFQAGALVPALVKARGTVNQLKRRLRRDVFVPVDGEAARGERRLDEGAVASLGQQICLYWARLAITDDDKRRHVLASLDYCNRGLESLSESLASGRCAEPADRILAARVCVNGFFGGYILDRLGENAIELSESRRFARRHGHPSMLAAAFYCSAATRDPRLAHYFAELTTLLPSGGTVARANAEVAREHVAAHPIETAARLLFFSKKLDGHETTPIRAWKPVWLEERIPQLESAIVLVEEAENPRVEAPSRLN
jgi:hypothetical protein